MRRFKRLCICLQTTDGEENLDGIIEAHDGRRVRFGWRLGHLMVGNRFPFDLTVGPALIGAVERVMRENGRAR